MVIFYFLGVGPPCCSILCQFWLCEEAQCVYLRRHLGSRFNDFKTCIVLACAVVPQLFINEVTPLVHEVPVNRQTSFVLVNTSMP